jgi:hypothetical protein
MAQSLLNMKHSAAFILLGVIAESDPDHSCQAGSLRLLFRISLQLGRSRLSCRNPTQYGHTASCYQQGHQPS